MEDYWNMFGHVHVHKLPLNGAGSKRWKSTKQGTHDRWIFSNPNPCQITFYLTRQTREAATAAVKIVFQKPACQLLYSAHARVKTMKEGSPGSCIYGDWPLCVVKKWKGWICMKITSFTIVPTLNRCNGNVEVWIEPHATDQWAFSPCKACL